MVITFLVIVSILYFITNYAFKNIILSPRKTKEDAFNLLSEKNIYNKENFDESILEEIKIKSSDNLELNGYYVKNSCDSNKVMILIHGYTANHYMSLQFLDFYLNKGFNILLIDSRSHGKSLGKYATYGIKERDDIKLWIDFLRVKLGNHIIIGLHGQSMGASTALMYGGKYKDIDFIIADCPYSSGRDILKYQFKNIVKVPPYPLYQMVNTLFNIRCKFSMNKVSPLDDISNLKIPILFIHGKNDKIIPYSMSKKMYDIRNNPDDKILLVKDADHVDSYMCDKVTYEKTIDDFINATIKYI